MSSLRMLFQRWLRLPAGQPCHKLGALPRQLWHRALCCCYSPCQSDVRQMQVVTPLSSSGSSVAMPGEGSSRLVLGMAWQVCEVQSRGGRG